MKARTLHIRHALFLCAFFFGFVGVSWGQAQNVFSRSDAGTGFWWHSNNPWYYATWNNNQDRPDNNSSTRNYVKIGHNNNTSMTTNGAFFSLASLDFESGASAPRTIAADVSSSGLSFTIGIFNASTGTHSFSTNIGVDAATVSFQNNNIGGMVFSGNFYLNSNTADFGGSGTGNFDVSAILSGTDGKIVKNGTNSLVLSGANTYTGLTTVNAGILQLNKSGGGTLPSGNSITVNNGGTLRISSNQTLNNLTIMSGGTVLVDANVQLTIDGALINNGTFTFESGATFKQGSSISGNGTFNVKQTINGANNGTAPNGRFWYMGVPMSGLTKGTAFGTASGPTETKVWGFTETAANGWGSNLSSSIGLQETKGYAIRTGESNPTITFSGNNLFSSDTTISLSYTNGFGNGFHLMCNSYMAPISWEAIYLASNNIDATYWVRSYNGSSLTLEFDTYNAASNQSVNPSTLLTNEYIAPLQSFWVRALPNTSNQSITMAKTMTSHQSGNILKSSIDFPVFARVNLIDDNKFDQTLIYMDQSMSSNFDAYDSEKMFVSGKVQLYTKVGAKKLVMNGLKNNKKKISAPLYLELPTSKVYQLQLAEFNMEEGLILLEDKQEGVIQDFTINDTYTFFADAGNLQNRFVLYFTMPQAGPTAQGPSNNWVNEQTEFVEIGTIEVNSNCSGRVEINLESTNGNKVSGKVIVTDINGKIVYQNCLYENKTILDIEAPSGIYYLSVESGDLIEKKKVFIQN